MELALSDTNFVPILFAMEYAVDRTIVITKKLIFF
jgi:hypothetical protein